MWNELKPKGKICLILLFPLAVAMVAIMSQKVLAQKGCAAIVGFWGHVGVGAEALVLGLFMAAIATGLLRVILGVPEIAGAAKGSLEARRQKRARDIEVYGHTVSSVDWAFYKGLTLVCLCVGAAIVLFGAGIGYIAWLLSC